MANGQANFTNVDTTTYGSYVPINCDTGYEASGGSEAECLASGSWSTDVTCVVIGLFTLSIIISDCFLLLNGNYWYVILMNIHVRRSFKWLYSGCIWQPVC